LIGLDRGACVKEPFFPRRRPSSLAEPRRVLLSRPASSGSLSGEEKLGIGLSEDEQGDRP
jgi:hypothetical protein